jgi:PPK2 family polyphosphate:nucleotide phosphotransferase
MSLYKRFIVPLDEKLRLREFYPASTLKYGHSDQAKAEIAKQADRLKKLQAALYAESQQSLLIVLQGLDAAGKDGTVHHVFSATNPQGVKVVSFKEPTPIELAHDFLWRVHAQVPAKGEIVIFNRSHYEDVLVARVHNLVPKSVWRARARRICEFEELLAEAGTRIVKFMLHISPKEQLRRFAERLADPSRNWKISLSDYKEREFWGAYLTAFEDAIDKTNSPSAPWFVVPSDHKWFRDLVISTVLVDTLEDMKIQLPQPKVDLDAVRREFHLAEDEETIDEKLGLVPGDRKGKTKNRKTG